MKRQRAVTIEQMERHAREEADCSWSVALNVSRVVGAKSKADWLEVTLIAARGPTAEYFVYMRNATPITRQQAAALLRKRNEEYCR